MGNLLNLHRDNESLGVQEVEHPSFIAALTEQRFSFEGVTVQNFERRSITGKKYPGLRRRDGASVAGTLWFDIDPSSMRMLDCFEDDLYEKQTLEIVSISRGKIEAIAYIVPKNLEYTAHEKKFRLGICFREIAV